MIFSTYIQERKDAFEALGKMAEQVDAAAAMVVETLARGNKLLTCGNGGSAAEAQHFSTELIGRFKSDRPSLPALSLNADGTAMTCIINDFGPDAVFSRQLEGLAQPGDCLAVFSSSGNSSNIVAVLERARSLEIPSLAFLGKDGGRCRGLATREIVVRSSSTAVVQEIHLLLLHYICEKIESAFPG